MTSNDIESCICDMHDVRNSILRAGLAQSPKDNEGSEIPLIDCVDDVLGHLSADLKMKEEVE